MERTESANVDEHSGSDPEDLLRLLELTVSRRTTHVRARRKFRGILSAVRRRQSEVRFFEVEGEPAQSNFFRYRVERTRENTTRNGNHPRSSSRPFEEHVHVSLRLS